MVDPVSLVLITGAAAVGLVAGKFKSKELVESTRTEISPHATQRSKIHFISIKNEVNPDRIISYAKKGQVVFINIKDLMLNPQVLNRFISELTLAASLNSLRLNQVSTELLYLTDKKQLTQIHTLSSSPSNQPIDDLDRFIESMAS